MWRMLQQPPAGLFVGKRKTHSVQELVEAAFSHVGLDWQLRGHDAKFHPPR